MGFKLSQKAIREFRPLVLDSKGDVVRDTLLERVLEHIADRTFQVDTDSDPVRESGSTISKAGLAEQIGCKRDTIKAKIDILLDMGVLVDEGATPRGATKFGVDLSNMKYLNTNAYVPNGRAATCPTGGHKHIPIDPIDTSTTSPLPIYSETPSPPAPTQVGTAVEERASEESNGHREGEGNQPPITDLIPELEGTYEIFQGMPSDLHDSSFLEADQLEGEKIQADTVDPVTAASRHLEALKLPWAPMPQAYLAMKSQAPDINVDMVLTTYVAWCRDNDRKPTMSNWMAWVEKRQAAETARQKEVAEKAAVEQRRSKSWVSKLGGDY